MEKHASANLSNMPWILLRANYSNNRDKAYVMYNANKQCCNDGTVYPHGPGCDD